MHPTVERYLEAALTGVPRGDRAEVRSELRSAIGDAVRDHLDGATTEDAAVEAVLEQLGDPLRLASRYSSQPLGLVSAERYPAWRRLIRLLLLTVVPLVFVAFLVVETERGAAPLGVVGGAAFAALEATVHIGFWTTLGFALADRLAPPTPSTEDETPWTVADLPPPGTPGIGTGEAWLWAGSALTGALLIALQRVAPVTSDVEGHVHLLAPAGWSFWWPYFITVLVLLAATVVAARVRGTWSLPLRGATFVLEAAVALPAMWLLGTGRVLDPRLVERLDDLARSLGWGLRTPASEILVVVLMAVIGITLIRSAVDALRTGRRLGEDAADRPG